MAALTACGCVAVDPPPAPPVSAGGARTGTPPVVQPQAKDDLETTASAPSVPAPRHQPSPHPIRAVEPSRAERPAAAPPRGDRPYERAGKDGGKRDGGHARGRGHGSSDGHDKPPDPAKRARSAGSGSTGVSGICALGEGYGGWPHGSPQARICRDTYGG